MPEPVPRTLTLTPEMIHIVDRLRGSLSPERFLLTLLKIADGRVIRRPGGFEPETSGPVLTPGEEESFRSQGEMKAALEARTDTDRADPSP